MNQFNSAFASNDGNVQIGTVGDFKANVSNISAVSAKVAKCSYQGNTYTLFKKVHDEMAAAPDNTLVYYYDANGHRRLTLNSEPSTNQDW